VTHAGCGALCPGYSRACYGCFGPKESPNTASLAARFAGDGMAKVDLVRRFRGIYNQATAFRDEADRHE
jgi:hypothetical protein